MHSEKTNDKFNKKPKITYEQNLNTISRISLFKHKFDKNSIILFSKV